MKNITLREIMSLATVTIDINNKTEEVKKLFEHHHLHHIPVVKEGKLAGIISLTDFLRVTLGAEIVEQGEAFDNEGINKVIYDYVTVEKLMTPNPVSLSPDSKLSDAIALFKVNMFHAIPIVEDGKVTGIVSTLDLLKHMENFLE
ncbi:MAG: Inosine-5'-monophosphate dehydrogenase [Bacteroidia bacterium]|nr:Inosine-5'-monophosphate dehydrogenase [Bacteroidia bacterium]